MQSLYLINNKNKIFTVLVLTLLSSSLSCKKYLDAKPDKSLVVPTSISDFQALLDNSEELNNSTPSWNIASSDNYYLTPSDYNSLLVRGQKAYIWEDYKEMSYPNDWSDIYDVVYRANVILQGIKKIIPNHQNKQAWNNVKGSALFFRAFSFLRAAFSFAKAYDERTAATDYGIVLKTDPDFNIIPNRSTVKETYHKIITDLKKAALLLPVIPQHVMRPSKPASYALLARTYLSMRKYDSCFKYADLCLQLKNELMDYNDDPDVDTSYFIIPFKQFNKEVIFSSIIRSYHYFPAVPSIARVDSSLYNSYSNNDLRKKAFFIKASVLSKHGGYIFQGTYNGTFSDLFLGIATDEVWLMRAECYARLGDKDAAMADLNTLLENRWETGSFIPFKAVNSKGALEIILRERRKELVFRGLRWMDIKRLNKEGANIVLKRVINNETHILPPNDPRYAHLIPIDVINSTGIRQNSR